MKSNTPYLSMLPLLLVTVLLIGSEPCEAARRGRPARPGGAYQPRVVARPDVAGPGVAGPGVAGPGVAGPGVAGPGVAGPGVAGPGVAGPGYARTLPADYERRPYRNRIYYYWGGVYYYEYYNEGQTIYVPAPVVDGEPTVPPRPYLDTLPPGSVKRTYGNLNFYYSDGEFYYEYSNDGPTIYVPAPVVNGVPKVPPRPYVYSLPTGYSIRSFAGVNYYDYLGHYYYVYYLNGRAVYVLATVVNGVPTVPPAPY